MSIRAVAELAGVAPSTVSLVLNKPDNVAVETRKAVFTAIKTLNYLPRERGRPRKGRDDPQGANCTNRIAFIAFGTPGQVLQVPIYLDVLHGVESELHNNRMTMVLRRATKENLADGRPLLPTRVDGMLLLGDPADSLIDPRLLEAPCVQLMGQIRPDRAWDHVSYDNSRIGKLAADYLLARNHKKCAFIGDGANESGHCGNERQTVFQAAMQAGGGSVDVLLKENLFIKSTGAQMVNRKGLAALVDRLLRLKPRPTGIFVEADQITSILYFILQERGIRPGVDLAIVSCNNERMVLQGLEPQPATVDVHAEQVGRRGVEQLLWRLAHPEDRRVTLALEPELVCQ